MKFTRALFKRKITWVILIAIVAGGYWWHRVSATKNVTPHYVTTKVERGTLMVSVSGSGQVSASNQLDLKPKASGAVVYIGVNNGQIIKAGTLVAQLDTRDAGKTVRDALASLQSTQISLDKLKKSADGLSVLQAQNALEQARESKQQAADSLKKSYEDGFNTIANVFLDLPSIITGMDTILYDETFDKSMWNIDWYTNQGVSYSYENYGKILSYKNDVIKTYTDAKHLYNDSFDAYKAASRASDTSTIETLLTQTYETVKVVADSIKSANNFLNFIQDIMVKYQYKIVIPAAMSGHLTSLDTFTGKTNTHLLNLLANKQSIENTKISLINSDRVIAEKTGSLSKLQAGTDPLDIKAQEISVQQRENALADAREQLSNYFIRAPFNGVIAKVAVKKGDPVSSATVVATLVSKQQLAEISLNEVDVAKIKLGQKATLTFDAVPDLSLTGAVAEIDALGAVTQGVVSYNVKISFDTQDDRVKPGMSVSATIITQVKQNVLIVPASALKTQGTTRYVEIFDPALPRVAGGSQGSVSSATPPQPREVKVGASNDADAEIISGLKAGEQIVVRTIIPTTAAKPTGQTAPSLFGSGNGRGVGGAGAVRIPR